MKAPQDIILRPIITERSIDMLPSGKYTFKVAKDANKIEIAKAVAELFGVKVAKVNTINVYDILNCDKFIVAKSALEKIEEVYA